MSKNRTGTICLLGAGASADAGYPLASDLLRSFRALLGKSEIDVAYVAPERTSADRSFSLVDVFDRLWSLYERSLLGSRAYLEDFFAFYDDPNNLGHAFAEEWGIRAQYFETKMLRQLRSLALTVAYQALGARNKSPADYLRRLFTLRAPEPYHSAIATLNFDVTVEQQAELASYKIYDGFRDIADLKPPSEWQNHKLEGLVRRWEHISAIGQDFAGFADAPAGEGLLLKLHGSIGWYTLEEGADWIGMQALARHNPVYRFFRVPYRRFWEEDLTEDDQILRVGQYGDGTLTRKSGAIWINPYAAFARAYKAYPDPLMLELLRTFSELIDATKTLVTVGYSWSDSHINDLLLGGVARGAQLVHVGMNPAAEGVVTLWRNKFRTTFDCLKRRLFVFGGGAQRCLCTSTVELLPGDQINLDLVSALNDRLTPELSLEAN